MLSCFSRSLSSSSPENKKERYEVLEIDNEDKFLERETVEDTFHNHTLDISPLQGNEVSQEGDGSS